MTGGDLLQSLLHYTSSCFALSGSPLETIILLSSSLLDKTSSYSLQCQALKVHKANECNPECPHEELELKLN